MPPRIRRPRHRSPRSHRARCMISATDAIWAIPRGIAEHKHWRGSATSEPSPLNIKTTPKTQPPKPQTISKIAGTFSFCVPPRNCDFVLEDFFPDVDSPSVLEDFFPDVHPHSYQQLPRVLPHFCWSQRGSAWRPRGWRCL